MNYQIVPFSYITRDTGVRAVLGSELVARIPGAALGEIPYNSAPYYKGDAYETTGVGVSSLAGQPAPASYPLSIPPERLPINLDECNGTLRQFQDKFANWSVFRSPAEICSIYLVPYDNVSKTRYTDWFTNGVLNSGTGVPTYFYPNADYNTSDSWYGSDFAGVGDNVRERPYADIYPRLTTKSNTYTVYYTVQAIKNPSSDPTQWNETAGAVLGQYRGSTSLERYLDPNDPNIPDYADGTNPINNPNKLSIDHFYKWRVISSDAFAP
jgi:hypothetical protein